MRTKPALAAENDEMLHISTLFANALAALYSKYKKPNSR